MIKIHTIECGNFMLDGGAMFGVVPKTLWEKQYPANEKNLCNLSTRCLLVEEDDRKILIDCGLGNKQSAKFFGYYYLNGDDSLEKSLNQVGVKPDDITDVILTHLHFDHCGGAVKRDGDSLKPYFPNAYYYVSKEHWKWAQHPNKREKASFFAENIYPLEDAGKLRYIHNNGKLTDHVTIKTYDGHTQGLSVPHISYNGKTLVYLSDLIPTSAHINVTWVCGFDVQPLKSLEEKESFLTEAYENNYYLIFEHDLYTEACTLEMTEKGIRKGKSYTINDILNM